MRQKKETRICFHCKTVETDVPEIELFNLEFEATKTYSKNAKGKDFNPKGFDIDS